MVVEGFGDERFGVEKVVENLAINVLHKGLDIEIITMVIDGVIDLQLQKHVHQVSYWDGIGQVRFHPKQYSEVLALIKKINPDVVHCHGCFSSLHVSAIRSTKKLGIPAIISSHGMLEPWLWKQKGVLYYCLKWVYWNILLKPVLKHTNFTHAITDQESKTLKQELSGIPQIKISNAIDLAEYSVNQKVPSLDRYLLFVGRIHPVKGVGLLIQAFRKASLEGVKLIIAGPDYDMEYTAKLKALVVDLNLSGKVSFVGSVHGEQKRQLFEKAWCVVVSSYSEVMALVNLESAASFTPTITTTMTGLSDWEDGGGVLVEPELEPLTSAMIQVCNWSQDERMALGKRAQAFVEERYSWGVIGDQWVEAYNMIAEQVK